MTNNNELLELKELGLKKLRKGQYFLLSPYNQFVTVKKVTNYYSIEIDGTPIKSRDLSLDSIKQIIKILY